jgi:membrane protease subunit (stomatin/prohibitin family)
MAGIVAFTDNINDLSNNDGYQFEFVCERCGNGYRSPFQRDVAETGRGILRAAAGLFGGKLNRLSGAAESWQYDRNTNSPAKDKAMREAVEAVRGEFKQCRGCGNWVCGSVCWNDSIGQCRKCSPSIEEEVAKARAAAQVEQVWEKAKDVDWAATIDVEDGASVVCPHCSAKVDSGNFCPECGGRLAPRTVSCTKCGTEVDAGDKFCGECGTPVPR